tara:strand:+ start:243 stop:1664 length:1422 start_codon:yes stop_codon:yes gene_type:complete
MKLALINLEDDMEHPAMGLVFLATYLEKKGFDNTEIIDRCFEKNILLKLDDIRPTIIGISAKTVHYALAIELANQIRKKFKDIILILGGAHITTMPDSLDKVFDLGVVGEGEETILEIINMLKKREKDYFKIKGIVYFDNQGIFKKTENRLPIIPLDTIPSPNLSHINPKFIKEMNSSFNVGNRGFVITSRGCPFKCIYCSTTRVWNKLRFNSPERVVKEINNWIEVFSVNQIRIMDDLFGVSKSRLRSLADLIENEGINKQVGFIISLRVTSVDEETCKLLKRIGVKKVNFGFDSGNDRVLKMLKGEGIKVEDIKKAVKLCQKYDILVEGSLIYASPTESIKEMKDTLDLIKWMTKQKNVENIWSFVMTPLPATEIWEIAEKRGKVSKEMDWRNLSYYRENDPLLLDADYNEFLKIWEETKVKIKVFKWRRIKRTITNNPGYFVRKCFEKPKLIFNLFFYKRVIDQEYIKEK